MGEAEGTVAVTMTIATHCHPLFPPRARIQGTETKLKLSLYAKFKASLGIILGFKAAIGNADNITEHSTEVPFFHI